MRVHRWSLDKKTDKTRAVHLREGPLGSFFYHALKIGCSVTDVAIYRQGTVRVGLLIEETYVDQFIETTGFGLTEDFKKETDEPDF